MRNRREETVERVDLSQLDGSDLIPTRSEAKKPSLSREVVPEIESVNVREAPRQRSAEDAPHIRISNPRIWSPVIPGIDDDDCEAF